MAVVELPPAELPTAERRQRAPFAPRPASRTSSIIAGLTVEHAIYLAIFALALLSRFWGLGDRALHHDETLHAAFSWDVFKGKGFVHDPLLHGPFLYFFGALIFFLFGDGDASARFGPALFGSILVVSPYFIRHELGRRAAIIAAVALLISPVTLYMGRFIRHDPYTILFEMLGIVAGIRFFATRRSIWLFVGAAALGLMAATMETFYLYLVITLPVLLLALLWRTWRPGIAVIALAGVAVLALVFVLPGKPERPSPQSDTVQRVNGPFVCPGGDAAPPPNPIVVARPGPIFGFGPLESSDNQYALCVRNAPDNNLPRYLAALWPFFSHPAVLLAMLVVALTAAGLIWQIGYRRLEGGTLWRRARATPDPVLDGFAALGVRRAWLTALGVFFVPYAVLFSAFFTNPLGVVTGTTGSLIYWLAQHDVQRGNQPPHYYAVMLAIYEPVITLWAIVGIGAVALLLIRWARTRVAPQGLAAPLLLAWWAITTFALYSWAGEKMPWLTLHLVLPITLLGAWAFERAVRQVAGERGGVASESADASAAELPLPLRPLIVFVAASAAIVALGFIAIVVSLTPGVGQYDRLPYIPLVIGLLLLLLAGGAALLCGRRWAIGALAIAVTLFGGVYAVRSAYQLSFRWGDVPREMMIYTQTSPDVQRTIDRLEQASFRTGSGQLNMPVWYDNETVWDWYMRNFSAAKEIPATLTESPGPGVQAVLMLYENYQQPENSARLDGFVVQRYPLRWWFPESEFYRLPDGWRSAPVEPSSSVLMRMLRTPLDPKTAADYWRYMIYRVPPEALGSSDFVLAVRPALAPFFGLGVGGKP